jgi:hypothetical protein
MDMTLEKTFIDSFLQEREYELDGTQTFMLYDNENQENLLAMVYDETDLEKASQYYSSGVWFICDNTKESNVILNERKYKKKIKFPKEPKERPSYVERMEEFRLSSKIGDLR